MDNANNYHPRVFLDSQSMVRVTWNTSLQIPRYYALMTPTQLTCDILTKLFQQGSDLIYCAIADPASCPPTSQLHSIFGDKDHTGKCVQSIA
eukprot:2136674-Amphidinium_carterae.1